MCNALKHSSSCNCGFGPPYPPRYSVHRTTSWATWTEGSTERIRQSLLEAGWDLGGVDEFLRAYAAGQRDTTDTSSVAQRLEELLGLRETRVEHAEIVTVEVPLFAFSAPAIPRARVVYTETRTTTHSGSWSLSWKPIGTSHAALLDVEHLISYTASAGTCKLVLVPVAVRVEQVVTIHHGQVVGRGVRAGALPPAESSDPDLRQRAVQSMRASELPEPTTPRFSDLVLDVSRDRTRDIHSAHRAWKLDVAREVSVAVPGISVSANVKVRQLNELRLAFELPSGHHYQADIYPTHLRWRQPAGERAVRRRRAA
jgi:hypothetical protein